MKIILNKISLLFIIVLAFANSGCQSKKDDDFAIFLLAQDTPATELVHTDINRLILESEPILSIDDIISYDKTNHTIELTQEAYNRIQQIFPMPVKVDGIPFVVCVGKDRIYTGAFWTPASSISYDGVVIMEPFDAKLTTIPIVLGYPGTEVFTGKDPRADPRIMKTLEDDGKLK
jgi:hypothetical protein